MEKTVLSESTDTVFESPGDRQLGERSGGVSVAVLKTECGRKSMEFESTPHPPHSCVRPDVR